MDPSAEGGLLSGVRVLEIGGIGPVPHAGMLLALLGADVVRVDRPEEIADHRAWDATRRGRTLVSADLKNHEDLVRVRELAGRADVLLEGFRPGVMERIGLDPDSLCAVNPALVYARLTGWGQSGPWAARAGHDINYIGLTGALHAIGTEEPVPPLNLLGDFGAGSTYAALGIVSALLRRAQTGEGCVLDAAIVDGTNSLMQLIWSMRATDRWGDERASNTLDGGAPYYRSYRCADGGFMAVGALEPLFYAQLLNGLEIDPDFVPDREDREQWPALQAVLATAFARHPRRHWEDVFAETDACVTPVLTMAEATAHEHIAARRGLRDTGDGVLAAAAPRESGEDPVFLNPSVVGALETACDRWPPVAGAAAT